MADTVDSVTLEDGPRNLIIRLTNISDGTGESAVTKVDTSSFSNMAPHQPPVYTVVEAIDYSIQGFTSVRLFFET